MLKPWLLYRALDPEQRRLLQEKQLAATRPVADFLRLLRPLGRFDAAGNKAGRRSGKMAVASGIGAVVTAWMGLGGQAPAPFFAVPAGFVGLCVGLGLVWRSLRRVDVSDNLRAVALPVLVVLREEVNPKRPLTLKLDLRRHDLPDKLVERKTFGAPGGGSVVESLYKDAWMSGRAELADGARLGFDAVDEIRERKRSRRNARGKTKTKTKIRTWSTYTVTLDLPESYRTEGAAGSGAPLKLSRTVKADTLARDPFALFDLMAAVYGRATPTAPKASAR